MNRYPASSFSSSISKRTRKGYRWTVRDPGGAVIAEGYADTKHWAKLTAKREIRLRAA